MSNPIDYGDLQMTAPIEFRPRKFTFPIPTVPDEFGEQDSRHKIYILRCGGFIKIGTTTNLPRRLRSFIGMTPFEIELVSAFLGNQRREHQLHQQFAECHHRDEWFREEGKLAAWIARGCATIVEVT